VSLGLLTQPGQLAVLMTAVVLVLAQGFVLNRATGLPYLLWSARPASDVAVKKMP